MSQAGTQGSDDMLIFGQSTKEEASSAVEQIRENPESLGILGNAAAQEISTLPPISSREATVIIPRADGKGGVIDLSAVRREHQVQQMQAELLESIRPQAAPVESIPVTPSQPEISSVQAQIEARTAEIRQMKLQTAREPNQVTEAPSETPTKNSIVIELFEAVQKLLPKQEQPLALYTARQKKKAA